MNENDVVTTLQNVRKDLGVVFMDNLKPSTQCVKSAAKAQSVLSLIKRTFKNIDKEDFMTLYTVSQIKTPMRTIVHNFVKFLPIFTIL